jgi:hypothetical protein
MPRVWWWRWTWCSVCGDGMVQEVQGGGDCLVDGNGGRLVKEIICFRGLRRPVQNPQRLYSVFVTKPTTSH